MDNFQFLHLFTRTQEYNAYGMYHDFKVQRQRNILDIHKVILHTFNHFIHVFRIPELHHTPTGQPRLHLQQIAIFRVFRSDLVYIVFSLRSWPTRLISPLMILNNCGSSSSLHRLIILPHFVMRESLSLLNCGPFCSACNIMERNL
jgi:hypothetical protein